MREFWIFAAACSMLVFGLLFFLAGAFDRNLRQIAAPCEAAGGIIVLGPNKDWVCVAPIIVKPQHKVLL